MFLLLILRRKAGFGQRITARSEEAFLTPSSARPAGQLDKGLKTSLNHDAVSWKSVRSTPAATQRRAHRNCPTAQRCARCSPSILASFFPKSNIPKSRRCGRRACRNGLDLEKPPRRARRLRIAAQLRSAPGGTLHAASPLELLNAMRYVTIYIVRSATWAPSIWLTLRRI